MACRPMHALNNNMKQVDTVPKGSTHHLLDGGEGTEDILGLEIPENLDISWGLEFLDPAGDILGFFISLKFQV